MRHFRIAALQLALTGEDNLGLIAAEVASAKRRFPWIDMVVLPELCAFGPKTRCAQRAGGAAEQTFCRMAREHGVWLIPGSLFLSEGTEIFNAAPVINPAGEVVARYRKIYPFRPYEQGVSSGNAFCVFTVPGIGRFGLCICYDLWFPEVARTLAWMGAEVVLCPTLTNTIDRDVEVAMARASAAGNQCYFISVNAASPGGMGRSVACGPGGEILHEAGPSQEVLALDIDLDEVEYVRRNGWHGLGQVLKSFRDTPVVYPPYQSGAQSAAFASLGPLTAIPRRESADAAPTVNAERGADK